jgi:carboxyl-terminal processing protease
MGQKLKIAGWIAGRYGRRIDHGVACRRWRAVRWRRCRWKSCNSWRPCFGMVKSDYVEPVDEKKLITDAISGMVSSLDPHSQYFDKKSFKEFREGTIRQVCWRGH